MVVTLLGALLIDVEVCEPPDSETNSQRYRTLLSSSLTMKSINLESFYPSLSLADSLLLCSQVE
jgi:hypothetical protein